MSKPGMRLLLLLGLLLLPRAASARDDVCTFRSMGYWSAVDAYSGEVACVGGAGSPSADDTFVVPFGVVVIVTGDIVQSASAPAIGITVQAGGSLVALVAAVTTGGRAIELRVGPDGIRCEGGSSCLLHGGYRRSRPDSVGAFPPMESLRQGTEFRAGRILPCEGDCTQRPDRVQLGFDPAEGGASGPATVLPGALGAIDPSTDVICFHDPNPNDRVVGADSGYCYFVADRTDSPPLALSFSIRQGDRNQAGYTLARRDVHEGTLAADVAPGATMLRFVDASLIAFDSDQVGRWVRCADGAGVPETRAYKIRATTSGPSPTVTIGDLRGFAHGYSAGERCWIDWGWETGDPFYVMAPVVVRSSTAAEADSPFRCEGKCQIQAVVFDDLGDELGNGNIGGDVQIVSQERVVFDHVWVTDSTSPDRMALYLGNAPDGTTYSNITVTGGSESSDSDKSYRILVGGCATCSYVLEDVSTRFSGDDNLAVINHPAYGFGSLTLRRFHAGPSSRPGDSGQLVDTSMNPVRLTFSDALCDACTSADGFGGGFLLGPSSSPSQVSHALFWAIYGPITSNLPPEAANTFSDIAFIGGGWYPPDLRVGPVTPQRTDRFYARHVIHDSGTGYPISLARGLGAATTRSLAHGIWYDVRVDGTPIELNGDASIEDVVALDVDRFTPGPIALLYRPFGSIALSRFTVAYTPAHGPAVGAGGIALDTPPPGALLLDGPLLTGLSAPGAFPAFALYAGSAQAAAGITFGQQPCFYGNSFDAPADELDAYQVPPVRGYDPGFVDPAHLRFDVKPGSLAGDVGCGTRDAGIRQVDWAHAKSKILPMYMGDTDGDGVADPQDTCPDVFDPNQLDSDGDGVGDACDDCRTVPNGDQADRGGIGTALPDSIGDACQCGDVDGSGSVTETDAMLVRRSLLLPPTATLAHPELCNVDGIAGCTNRDAAILTGAVMEPPVATILQQCAPPAP